ncbi:TonB-dependent receptor [Sphingomonas sp. BIUV-7]|uniref:TonB-dependent receptor n=1 Tax=Sphingomonas natans TaxID=3063330 RepID=A0ABT8YC77_9SPHN|nr:TonB-dependent receptor [Sphingomonas sp. BIUV-7]MDO6415245.1 TonB-dependent receptor [Sphingomonas sp. BIUV-7]
MSQTLARRSRLCAGAALFTLLIAQSANAQNAAAQDQVSSPSATPADLAPATTAPSEGLEDIVVTAERRSQSLQDVPISATVLNAADLSRKGVNNIADLQQVAPSLTINTFNRSTFINIRGVGIAQSAPTSNPGVAFYIDGQLIPHEQFIGQSFYDIGTIEVLRGPQGTLTGQNSTGGALYVRTPEPDFEKYSGYLDATYGNYDALKVVGALNVPISDEAAVRVAAVHDKRDSFVDNIGPSPSQPGNVDLNAARFNLAVRSPNEVLRANIRGDYFNSKSDNNAVKRRNDTVSTDPFVIEEDARSLQNQHGGKLSGEVRVAVVPSVDLRVMTSYQDLHTVDQTDGDRTATARPRPPANAVGRVSRVNTDINTFIGEVNLLSTGKRDLNWVVGGFYLNEFVDTLSRRDNNNVLDFVSSTSTFQTRAENTTKSVFGQVNWYFTPALEAIAGARYSDDEQIYNRLIPAGAVPPGASVIGVQHSTKVTGKVGLNYHFDRNLLYVTASQGYKAGGVNLTIGTPNFGPETNRVYETGFKTQFLDNRLRVNGDVFYSKYKDIQLSSLLGTLPVTQNAAAGKSYGAELEVTGQFGALGFNAGGGYLHARFDGATCITDTNSAGTDPGCPANLRLVPDGRVLPFSPKWTINAGIQYEVELNPDGKSLTPRVQWSHLAQQVATPFPSFNTIVPSRNVFDARLTFQITRQYKIEGYVSNFTNKTYIASQVQSSSSADGGIIYGAPRTYGIRGVAKF